MTFYERYAAICRSYGVSPSRAAEDAGLTRSTVTRWKQLPDAMPTGKVIDRLAAYFGMPPADLLTDPDAGELEDTGLPEDRILIGLFGTSAGVTPEMYAEVKDFAAFILNRARQKNPLPLPARQAPSAEDPDETGEDCV